MPLSRPGHAVRVTPPPKPDGTARHSFKAVVRAVSPCGRFVTVVKTAGTSNALTGSPIVVGVDQIETGGSE